MNNGGIGMSDTKMEKINFEEIMVELEKTAQELESGELNLDESVEKFEQGMKLSKKASKVLEEAEKKITILLEKDGKIQEEEFKPGE